MGKHFNSCENSYHGSGIYIAAKYVIEDNLSVGLFARKKGMCNRAKYHFILG